MTNKIIDGYLKKFVDEFGNFDTKSKEEIFEHFINYLITRKEYTDDFEIENLHLGGSSDCGIDGIVVLINDFIVDNIETAKYLIEDLFKNKDIKVKFAFIQSKTSRSFKSGEILTFFNGVKSFFDNSWSASCNDRMKVFIEVQDYIFENSSKFVINPTLDLYYVTLGKYEKPRELEEIKDKTISEFEDFDLFSDIRIRYLDTKNIINIYKDVELRTEKEINIQRITPFPTTQDVEQAYMAIVSLKDYLNLITDENNELIRSIFYDNVRDYQGDNPVNMEIFNTINSSKQKYFGYLNNGITIVAKELNKVGDRVILRDFQVVNGCQTSTILFNNKEKIIDEAFLPIKLICTSDNEIINMIIRATNRQTEVKPEAFESLSEFHKNLEEFYNMYDIFEKDRIYYERRNKQYAQQNIPKNKIITLASQIKSYISVFKEQPHSTHRYYGELLKSNRIFQKEDNLFPYYLSAFLVYKIDELFRNGDLYFKYKKFRYHIALMVRQSIAGEYKLYPNSKDNDKYCEKIFRFILSSDFKTQCIKICSFIEKTKRKYFSGFPEYKLVRLKDFTHKLLENSHYMI